MWPVEKKATCWLVDVDGTLAIRNGRSPYDMTRVAEDQPNLPVVTLVQALDLHPSIDCIIVLSGRDESARVATETWLEKNDIPFRTLLMRAIGDSRPDHIVKREFCARIVEEGYEISGVIDDRSSVVEMWRSLGLTCLQAARGDF